jgi:hypothetical protein
MSVGLSRADNQGRRGPVSREPPPVYYVVGGAGQVTMQLEALPETSTDHLSRGRRGPVSQEPPPSTMVVGGASQVTVQLEALPVVSTGRWQCRNLQHKKRASTP